MKRKKELTQQNTSHRALKHLSLSLIIIFSFFNYGCDKEEDPDHYYVKYKIESSNIDINNKLNVSFKTENDKDISSIIMNQNRNWEMIIGPVTSGFEATLMVWNDKSELNNLQLIGEIHISKNDSPFSIKAIRSINNNLNYSINGFTLVYMIE